MSDSPSCSRRLGFIHIPKNAGTSVIKAIVDNGLPIDVSGHEYPGKVADEEIAVVRCPRSRFISAFHYGRKYWPSRVNENFASADERARSAADPGHPKHANAWIELGNRPEDLLMRDGKPSPQQAVGSKATEFAWVCEPQSTWRVNGPRHVLRFAHLADDFRALLRVEGLDDSAVLPRVNGSDSCEERLSLEAQAFLERIYAADFQVIGTRGMAA